MLIVDAHLDIAYNALRYGRDPRSSLEQIRAAEPPDHERGQATVTFPALRQGGVGVIFGTIFVLPAAMAEQMGGDVRYSYHDAQTAHRLGMKQLDYYWRLADDETSHVRVVDGAAALEEVLASQDEEAPLLGIVPLMEGADPIREPEELELWVEKGLRVLGLAWDDTRYCAGAWRGSREGLSRDGRLLLEIAAEHDLIVDVTHMNERACLETLSSYEGPVIASHSNARALVPGERQLSDKQIYQLGERDGVIGIVLYNRFLRPDHRKGDPKELVTLGQVVAHIDYVCQLLGDARHVGLGTDLDGGFGAADIPAELDSSADLPLVAGRLQQYGYEEEDIAGIMGRNWVRLLQAVLK